MSDATKRSRLKSERYESGVIPYKKMVINFESFITITPEDFNFFTEGDFINIIESEKRILYEEEGLLKRLHTIQITLNKPFKCLFNKFSSD